MMLDSSLSVLNSCSLSDDSIVLVKGQLQQLLFAADFVVDHMIQIIAVSVFLFKQTYLTQKMASVNISKKRGKYKKYLKDRYISVPRQTLWNQKKSEATDFNG